MKTVSSPSQMYSISMDERNKGKKVGFVPTMGYLHEGHLSLVRKAKELSDFVVVSIFVNPIQFGPGEDFDRYPRNPERDCQLLRELDVNVVFMPSSTDMYSADHSVFVDETTLSKGLCGAHRPGHFKGVSTVVAKLFNIVQPHVAIFGEKDFQQARIIQRMVRDLNFPIEIVIAPTVREADGLAMSSRNTYLSPAERKKATALFKALSVAREMCQNNITDVSILRESVEETILQHGDKSTVIPVKIEYIEIVHDETLVPLEKVIHPARMLIAVRIGNTRLIDNILLK